MSERVSAVLAADHQLQPECFDQLAAMMEVLRTLDMDQLPVAIVSPGVLEPAQAVLHLLECRPGMQLALVVDQDDLRSLGEHFRNLPVPARQVELLPALEHELVERVLAIGEAILQRTATRRAIRRTSERLAMTRPRTLDVTTKAVQDWIWESLPSGLIVLTPSGYIVQANKRALEMLGLPSGSDADSRNSAAHIHSLLPYWEGADADSHETLTIWTDGQLRYLRVRSTVIITDNAPQGTVITLEDITEQENAQRVLQASAEELRSRIDSESRKVGRIQRERDALRDFVITVTHDLRSPLAATDMQLQLLERHSKVHQAEWAWKGIDRAGQGLRRIDRMIEDLLDVARHDAGNQLNISPRACRLDRLVLEVVADLQSVHERDFDVRTPFPPISGVWDVDGVRRIIENLGNNAAKYGDPSLPISLWIEDVQDYVVMNVRNFGTPIPIETQRILFQPFYRSVLDTAGATKGWGVGLSIVRALTEVHGGSVAVVSSEQSGTVFTVTLPKSVSSG